MIFVQQGDLFIYMGDNVYGDVYLWDVILLELCEVYVMFVAVEFFQNLCQFILMFVIWDDYDYGMNDFGCEFLFKGFVEELFLEFWGVFDDDECCF